MHRYGLLTLRLSWKVVSGTICRAFRHDGRLTASCLRLGDLSSARGLLLGTLCYSRSSISIDSFGMTIDPPSLGRARDLWQGLDHAARRRPSTWHDQDLAAVQKPPGKRTGAPLLLQTLALGHYRSDRRESCISDVILLKAVSMGSARSWLSSAAVKFSIRCL